MILQKQRAFTQAQELLARGLERFPGHRDLAVGQGVCLMNMGRFDQALDCFAPFDSDPGIGQYIDICKTRNTR
jgi:tetratricopeptide (TPR) repeat protein